MSWGVEFYDDFYEEFETLSEEVQDNILVKAKVLEEFGPHLGRPHVDTLNGSDYPNMKELRFGTQDGVWRVAFAFDPERKAILLVAGDKAGIKEKKFYKELINKADERYCQHLCILKNKKNKS